MSLSLIFVVLGKITLDIFEKMYYTINTCAGVMELVDVVDSKSTGGDTVPVRARPPAPHKNESYDTIGIATFVLFLCLQSLVRT